MDDVQELYQIFPELKEHIVVEKKVGQGKKIIFDKWKKIQFKILISVYTSGTFSYVYSGYFCRNKNEKLALKYIIPTSSPSRTKQEIECLLNIGCVNDDNNFKIRNSLTHSQSRRWLGPLVVTLLNLLTVYNLLYEIGAKKM